VNTVDDSVEAHIKLRAFELVARVLVVTAETEPRYRRGIGVLEVGVMPIQQSHILRHHFEKTLIL
jgi:hypothetical protein